jgi:hypothetical protein
MPPWRVLLWFKFTEMVLQCRPNAIYRVLFHRDRRLRHAMQWYTKMRRRVGRTRLSTSCVIAAQSWPNGEGVVGASRNKRGRVNVRRPIGAKESTSHFAIGRDVVRAPAPRD